MRVEEIDTPVPGTGWHELFMLLGWPCVAGIAAGVFWWKVIEEGPWTVLFDRMLSGFAWGAGVGVFLSVGWLVIVFGSRPISVTTSYDAESRPTVIDAHSPPAPEQIRLVPYRGPSRLIDGVPASDLRFFIDGLKIRGHTQRPWIGQIMPSGRRVDVEYWQQLVEVLKKAGVVVGAGPRQAGTLTTTDAQEIAELVGV